MSENKKKKSKNYKIVDFKNHEMLIKKHDQNEYSYLVFAIVDGDIEYTYYLCVDDIVVRNAMFDLLYNNSNNFLKTIYEEKLLTQL